MKKSQLRLLGPTFNESGKAISPSSQTTGSSVNSSTQKLHTSFTF